MTDEERARAFLTKSSSEIKSWTEIFCELHMPGPTYDIFKADLAAALSAVREACAKVAEEYRLEAGDVNQITLSGFVGRRIAQAIRTGHVVKP